MLDNKIVFPGIFKKNSGFDEATLIMVYNEIANSNCNNGYRK